MSDNVNHQEQATEIAEAVQKALVDSSPSERQNVTINVNYSPVYNNYGDNISIYSSSRSSSINSNNSISNSNNSNNNNNNSNNSNNSINIVEQNINQPLRIQTKPFLETTVYDSDEVMSQALFFC